MDIRDDTPGRRVVGSFPSLKPQTTVLILVDMQERLVEAMPEKAAQIISRQKILLQAMSLLGVDVIVTEQYPKGLGSTVGELSAIFSSALPVIEKNTFSCLGCPEVRKELARKKRETVLIAGIEAHVCVLQTVLDCLESGYGTAILRDAVNSRKESDMLTSMDAASMAGAYPLSVESAVFMLMKGSAHPVFRDVSKLMR